MQPIHIDTGLTLSQFLGSLPTFIAVILAWLYSNKRTDDARRELKEAIKAEAIFANTRLDDFRSELKGAMKTEAESIRAELRAEAALIRAEFRRVEEIMDARIKHLEEKN